MQKIKVLLYSMVMMLCIFLINGEPIKVGRRGFFEAPDGYEITDIAVTERNFIMDYKYEVMEGEMN